MSRQPINDGFTWMHSGQTGARYIGGNSSTDNGQLLLALDDCLVNGFNSQTVLDIVPNPSSVTINYSSAHGYVERQLLDIRGADDARLNGRHRVLSVKPTSIVVSVAGVVTTSGVITTKIAPLDFESLPVGGNPLRRAYRSKNLSGTRAILRLDMQLPSGHGYDSSFPAMRASINICSSLSATGDAVSSYIEPVKIAGNPNPSGVMSINGSYFWYQSKGRTKTAILENKNPSSWVVVGTGDYFYIFMGVWSDYNSPAYGREKGYRDIYMFGDVPSIHGEVDSLNCALVSAENWNDSETSTPVYTGARVDGVRPSGVFIGEGLSAQSIPLYMSPSGSIQSGYLSGAMPTASAKLFPCPVNGGMVATPVYLYTQASLRAIAPRLLAIPQGISLTNNKAYDLTITDNVLLISVGSDYVASPNYGYYAIDLGD